MNLNGPWQYAVVTESALPSQYQGDILVPYPIESALSGVKRRLEAGEELVYQRTFEVPAAWSGGRVHLHFGAVDWHATVWVNGTELGSHKGGYDPFSFDITDALGGGDALGTTPHTVTVRVADPTDSGTQPRGKQVREPKTIWYTPVTGIWQTVWLEAVPNHSIGDLKMVTTLGEGASPTDRLALSVETSNAPAGETTASTEPTDFEVSVEALGPGSQSLVTSERIPRGAAAQLRLDVPLPRRWSPSDPYLYDLIIELKDPATGKVLDRVTSYFGLREIRLSQDGEIAGLPPQLMLNGEALFQFGPLDQGWWPDGLYTPATDQALIHDLEVTRSLGFNMLRKHVKVESSRFYYHCDRLGLLVWQDMPNGDEHIRPDEPDIKRTAESNEQFKREWSEIIHALYNHPSIVMCGSVQRGVGTVRHPGDYRFH